MLCALFLSCAQNGLSDSEKILSHRKIRALEIDLKKSQATIENLKEQNWILKQKYVSENRVNTPKVPVPFQPSAGQAQTEDTLKADSNNLNQPKLSVAEVRAPKLEEASPTDSHESAEHNLYAKVIASYRQKNQNSLNRVTEILLKTYPQGVFADRAIFLNAKLEFENANDQAALIDCDKLIRNYPNASKLVSTFFLKAQILKKQGRFGEAKSVLADVQTYFPGSPEAYRVPLEMKLLSLQAKATK